MRFLRACGAAEVELKVSINESSQGNASQVLSLIILISLAFC